MNHPLCELHHSQEKKSPAEAGPSRTMGLRLSAWMSVPRRSGTLPWRHQPRQRDAGTLLGEEAAASQIAD